MRRKRKIPMQNNHERWVISYADFITLLFAFFVVMYSVSSVNLGKYRVLSESLEVAFRAKAGDFRHGFTGGSGLPLKINPNQNEIIAPNQGKEQGSGFAEKQANITRSYDKIKDELKNHIDDNLLLFRRHTDWVEIQINSSLLFTSNTEGLTPEAKALLASLGETLKDSKNPIIVEGHTDNKPINTPQYPSNWELSAARASGVARLLIEAGVDPKRVSVVAYGAQYPIADNSTLAGREKNRRVVVIIARHRAVQRLLHPESQSKLQRDKEKEAKANSIPVVKAIRLKSGGLRFTRDTIPKTDDDN